MRYFTEEHELFRSSLREFLEREVRPNINAWEKQKKIPRYVWEKMGEMGFLGLSYPEEYGGANLDFFYEVIFNEEIGRMNSGGFAVTQQSVQYMASPYIFKYGSSILKAKYLPGTINGKLIGCIGITEPDAGSDVQNIKTKAIKNGDHYIVNGSKTFITNAYYGDYVVTVVKTDPEKKSAGVSLLVIDLNSKGITKNKLEKLGWHASDTAELSFDNVKVPTENLIGEEGKGFKYLMNGLQLERLIFIPYSVASMEFAIEASLNYMSERKAFGKSIDKFQVLRHRIAKLSSKVQCLKAFGYYCSKLYDDKVYDVNLCSMAKLISTELHEKVATECLQFFGGYGYMEEYPMARMYRDVRIGTIGAGTSEIMREIIAKINIDKIQYKKADINTENVQNKLNIYYGEDHELFRQSLRNFILAFSNEKVESFVENIDSRRDFFKKLYEMGYFSHEVSGENDGFNFDSLQGMILNEEIARVKSRSFITMNHNFQMTQDYISRLGNPKQKETYLLKNEGEVLIGCNATYENFDHTDSSSITAEAKREGDYYLINGSKKIIASGINSDYFIISCKISNEKQNNGLSLIIIPKFLKGNDVTKKLNIKDFNADFKIIHFDNLKVPVENLLGEENQSLDYIFNQNLILSLSESASSVSNAELNLKATVEYINSQEYRGEKVSQIQSVRHNIAQMFTEFECTKQFLYTLYSRFLKEDDLQNEIMMLKYLSSKLEYKIKSNCTKIFNEFGFTRKYSSIDSINSNESAISEYASNSLLDIISNSIIDNVPIITKTKLKKEKTLAR